MRNRKDMTWIKSNDRKCFIFIGISFHFWFLIKVETFPASFLGRMAIEQVCQRDTKKKKQSKSILNNKLNIKTLMSSKSFLIPN